LFLPQTPSIVQSTLAKVDIRICHVVSAQQVVANLVFTMSLSGLLDRSYQVPLSSEQRTKLIVASGGAPQEDVEAVETALLQLGRHRKGQSATHSLLRDWLFPFDLEEDQVGIIPESCTLTQLVDAYELLQQRGTKHFSLRSCGAPSAQDTDNVSFAIGKRERPGEKEKEDNESSGNSESVDALTEPRVSSSRKESKNTEKETQRDTDEQLEEESLEAEVDQNEGTDESYVSEDCDEDEETGEEEDKETEEEDDGITEDEW